MNYLLLSSLSFFVGIVVGLTGIGGASLITPMLIFVFQVPPSVAISSDVVAAALMKIVGGVQHWKQQTIDLNVMKWLAFGSVPGAIAGVSLLHLLKQTDNFNLDYVLLRLLGAMILLVTIVALVELLLITFFPQLTFPSLPKVDLETFIGRCLALTVGGILGCIVGLTSVSSGSMFALALIAFFRLDASKLVGTDISHAAILLLVTALGHLSLGTVAWSLVIPIWIGSIPGVLVGATLCQLAPKRFLRFIIYMMLVMVSWKLAHAI